MSEVFGLFHLFITYFLYSIANVMVAPAITDVTMAAVCPGKDECSLAIYLTGAQQAIIGLGSVVAMPMIGTLSDTYGRKAMLTLPMILSIFPLVILAYSRKKYYFYAYYGLKTLIAMTVEGSTQVLAFAYVADNVEERTRGSMFGILAGIGTSSLVLGNAFSRFLSTSTTFQVAGVVSIIALLYMRIFLRESLTLKNSISTNVTEADCLLEKKNTRSNNWKHFKALISLDDTTSLLRTSPAFSKAAIVAFLNTFAEVGLGTALLYYLKARFQFNKDQFADLTIISGIAGSISQLILVPIFTPLLGEENMLSIGLFFTCAQMILFSVAWAPWVSSIHLLIKNLLTSIFLLRSISSKQTSQNEQEHIKWESSNVKFELDSIKNFKA
ncbi:hypothetical protein ACS0TY_036608 [Phlomoides rotata]